MPGSTSSLAIVIVTYNSRHEIGACLGSLVDIGAAASVEIVVVDNGSTDGTVEWIGRHAPAVRVLEPGGNVGFARANNAGARDTRGDYLLLLNPDTVVSDGALRRLLAALAADERAAIAGPRLVDGEGRPEISFGPPISPWGELKQKLLMTMYNRHVAAAVRYVERASRTAGERAWVTGACLLIRRGDWDAVGGFDERFFLYTEDVDLCASVRARGRRVLFVPEAEVRHLRGRSAGRNPMTEQLRRRSQVAYYEKHHPRWAGVLRLYLRLTGRGAHG